jgi:hypothetical protein
MSAFAGQTSTLKAYRHFSPHPLIPSLHPPHLHNNVVAVYIIHVGVMLQPLNQSPKNDFYSLFLRLSCFSVDAYLLEATDAEEANCGCIWKACRICISFFEASTAASYPPV